MSLQFIIGRAGSGKTYYCLEEIKRELRLNPQGDPMILLVPEQATHQYELSLTQDNELGGLIRLQVLSFERLTWRLLQEVGGSARIHLSDLGKRMVLRKIIEESKDKLKLFKNAAEQPGFIDQLVESLTELRQYCAEPAEILAKVGQESSGLLPAKLSDLVLLSGAMESYLAKGYLDPDDYLLLLAERIESSQMLTKARVWMDGYTGFTPQEYIVLGKLLSTVKDIKITFCLDREGLLGDLDDSHPFFPMRLAMDKIRNMAQAQNVKVKPTIILDGDPYRFQPNPCLKHLEKSYFSLPLKPYRQETSNLMLAGAVNRRAEVEAVARDILKLCREEGLRFRDIGIILRDLDSYHQLLTTIFSDYEIPYFIDQKRTVMHHPLVELLRSALEVITSNFNYEPIFRFLKTDLTPLNRDGVDLLENYCLAYGLRGSHWTSGKPWTYFKRHGMDDEEFDISSDKEEELKRINILRDHAAKPLLQLKKRLKKSKNVREYTKALYQLLVDLGAGEELARWKREAESSGQLDLAKEHVQVWNETLKLFDQVVEALGEEQLTIEEFRRVLDSGFESMRLSLIPPGLDQVLVTILGHSRCPEIKAAYVLGVNDGVLPARLKEQGIFSEREREMFSRQGIELAPSGRRRLFEEQYLIYTALTRSSTYLWVSYSLADEEGRALMPSQVISRFKALFPTLQEQLISLEPTEGESALNFICHREKTLTHLTAALREAKAGKEINPIWWEVYNHYIQLADGQKKRIIAALFHQNKAGFISSQLAAKLFGKKVKTSVSRLEKYAACPFAHFSAYGLKLEERNIYKLSPPDLGQFFHAALKDFVNHLSAHQLEWSQLTPAESRQIVARVVDNLLPKLQNEILLSTNRYRYLSRKLKRTVERSVRVLTEHARRGKFRPIGVELGFGPGEKLPPLVVELGNGMTMELTGRIDRADMATGENGNYFRVIDYKSSIQKLSLEEIYYGLKLQLLTYLEVILQNAEALVGETGFPAGLLYFPVKDPFVSSISPMPQEKLEDEILKKLKMQGFVLENPQVVKMMDGEISGYSKLVPAALKADGNFYANSAVFSLEQFKLLRHHLHQTLQKLGREIIDGKVEIAPYRRGSVTACRFCIYKSVCQFDVLFEDNVYRLIGQNDAEEIWLKIKGGGEV